MSSYTQTPLIRETSPFTCWCIEDGSFGSYNQYNYQIKNINNYNFSLINLVKVIRNIFFLIFVRSFLKIRIRLRLKLEHFIVKYKRKEN